MKASAVDIKQADNRGFFHQSLKSCFTWRQHARPLTSGPRRPLFNSRPLLFFLSFFSIMPLAQVLSGQDIPPQRSKCSPAGFRAAESLLFLPLAGGRKMPACRPLIGMARSHLPRLTTLPLHIPFRILTRTRESYFLRSFCGKTLNFGVCARCDKKTQTKGNLERPVHQVSNFNWMEGNGYGADISLKTFPLVKVKTAFWAITD